MSDRDKLLDETRRQAKGARDELLDKTRRQALKETRMMERTKAALITEMEGAKELRLFVR